MTAHPFHTWLARQLQANGQTWADLSRSAGIGEAAFTRWKAGKVNPSIEMVRRVSKALGMDTLRLLVIAEILEPEEVRQQVVVPDVTLLTDSELVREVERRMKGDPPPDEHPHPKNSPTPLFQVGPGR